jgi:AraC-like DNA-binding protein/ligand-binding sensor protein
VASKKTDPLLTKAWKILSTYAVATKTMVCVFDENYLPIPEIFTEITTEKNTCLYCIKHQGSGISPQKVEDLTASPCNLMHINAIKEAHHFGGSYIYMCDLGFIFWTSPLFLEGRFFGALLGAGFLGIDSEEATEAMHSIGRGSASEEEIRKHLAAFPQGRSEQIKALAELLLICAESLSADSGDYHEILKRRAMQQTVISEQISLLKTRYPEGTSAPGYPLDKERMLLAALRRGDNETGRNILNELLGVLFFTNPDHFKFIQFRAMELVVLLSRVTISPGFTEDVLLETNNHYLQRIQEVQNIEELTDELHTIVENMAGQIFSFQGVRHASALRKAERYIWENYTRKISLQEIASVSGLSAPYFSTIFKEEMGENLSSYLNRLRVEKASHLLTETKLSLSEIAGSCGFEDQSWFSKIFKSFTGVSPGKFRGQGGGTIMEISENNFSPGYRTITET